MRDYLPESDADFDTWQSNFLSALAARAAALGFHAPELAALEAARAEWQAAFAAHHAAHTAAVTATRAKNDVRGHFERAIRAAVKRLQALPEIEDEDRVALGVTVHAQTRAKAPAPASAPFAQIDTSQRLRHLIRFRDQASPRRARPAGVSGCEIWVKVGEPPAGPSDATFLALATASPYLATYTDSDAHRPAHYMLRWVNSRGERGPWGPTVTATITA